MPGMRQIYYTDYHFPPRAVLRATFGSELSAQIFGAEEFENEKEK